MRIRTAKDVEKLDQKIKNELGIDVQKYRNEEVVESFVELLIFPEYVVTWVIRPILISLLIFIIGFFTLDLVHVEYVLYGVIGIVLFLVTGVLIGVLFLMGKMKWDMWGILKYSLEMMKSAVSDVNQVNNQISAENRKEVLGLVFKGIIHIVTIPMMSKIISEKVPLIGGIINFFIKKVLTLISDKVKFDEELLKEELKKTENEPTALKNYSDSISFVSLGLEKIMNITFAIAEFPLKLGTGLVLLILALFIYLIN